MHPWERESEEREDVCVRVYTCVCVNAYTRKERPRVGWEEDDDEEIALKVHAPRRAELNIRAGIFDFGFATVV